MYEPLVTISSKIPVSLYQALAALAEQRGKRAMSLTVKEVLERGLALDARPGEPPDPAHGEPDVRGVECD